MEVSTGSVTALIGAPLLLWLLPRLRSMSAPDMNASNRIAAERQNVLMFTLAGGALLLLTTGGGAVVWPRCARLDMGQRRDAG